MAGRLLGPCWSWCLSWTALFPFHLVRHRPPNAADAYGGAKWTARFPTTSKSSCSSGAALVRRGEEEEEEEEEDNGDGLNLHEDDVGQTFDPVELGPAIVVSPSRRSAHDESDSANHYCDPTIGTSAQYLAETGNDNGETNYARDTEVHIVYCSVLVGDYQCTYYLRTYIVYV